MFRQDSKVLQDKFAKEIMIWQAICSWSLRSEVFLTNSSKNADLYIEECLQKRVLLMICLHNNLVKFWPDLASCHWAKKTKDWFLANNVDFIPIGINPPYCRQFRPIERHWAIVKKKLKKNNGTAYVIKKCTESGINLRDKWHRTLCRTWWAPFPDTSVNSSVRK